jgi:hypothetical protein
MNLARLLIAASGVLCAQNSPYTVNGNGTVTDRAGNRLWQQADGGEMTWERARDYCSALNLGGKTGWRLPTNYELFGILDHSRGKPALDPTVFTRSDAEYWWTSEVRADDPSRVWTVNAGGGTGPHPKRETISAGGEKRYHARCVLASRAETPASRYTANGDGTVTDRRTGLVWQQAESTPMSWEEALRYPQALSIGGRSNWRLPTIKELESLNDERIVRPSIPKTQFPGVVEDVYWSSNTLVNRPTRAWTVDFTFGIASYEEKTEKLRVRAVTNAAPPRQSRGRRGPDSGIFHVDIPSHPYDLILGRVEAESVTASVLSYSDMEGYVEYSGGKTPIVPLPKDKPANIPIRGLRPDTAYRYRFHYRMPGTEAFERSEEYAFHTQRRPGAPFTFAVQADSHLDENVSPETYTRTLTTMAASHPDFLIDLGDTFMVDKRRDSYREASAQYLAQRYYFGLIGRTAPVFLALGNHDGEGGARSGGGMGAWSMENRKRYFPNPQPDGFFTGNGAFEDYYAWTWGDALFVVLDPYWPTQGGRGRQDDNWYWTLGNEQYRWLKKTLESSRERFKFVFIHHPTGSKSQPVRGGIEAAKYNEWGGLNADGTDGFRQHRPAWEKPVHRLLVDNKVSAVFHGHDHMYVRESLDGIVYQLVPQPGNPRANRPRTAGEYGYVHGGLVAGSGYVRVSVNPEHAKVEFVRTTATGSEIADTYTIAASR